MEWLQQMRRPIIWFCLIAYFALAFFDTVQSGWSATGNIWINGADMILRRALIYSIIGTIAAAAIVSEPMCRDRQSRSQGLVLLAGTNRWVLGGGRFLAAFFVVLLTAMMFVPGVILGSFVSGTPAEQVGPFVPGHYANAFVQYVLPNFLITSALIYAVAARTQSQTAAFSVAIGYLALWILTRMMLGQDILRHDVFTKYALMDPYASIASNEFTCGWTNLEKNTTFPPFAGLLVWNRLLWISVSLGLIALGTLGIPWRLDSRKTRNGSAAVEFNLSDSSDKSDPSDSPISVATGQATFTTQLGQMIVWELRDIWRTPGVRIMFAFAALTLWWSAASAVTHQFSLPSTDLLVHNAGFYFDKILVLVAIWGAANLMWREQSVGVSELFDVQPTSDGARFLSKTIALVAIVLAFWLVSIGVGLLYQAVHGYYHFELGLYFTDSFIFKAPYYLWLAVLALAMQAVIGRRYIAIGVVLLIYVSETLLDALGWHHPMFRYGRVSFFWYSLMDGYGHFWKAHCWFLLYWTLGATSVWSLGLICFRRGREQRRIAPSRGQATLLLFSVVGFLVAGAHIWRESTVRAQWPPMDSNQQMAQVEKAFASTWRNEPQPRIVALKGELDLYPSERRFRFSGEQTLKNFSDEPIQRLLILGEPGLVIEELDLGVNAKLVAQHEELNAYELELADPIKPGERHVLKFVSSCAPPAGFAVHAPNDDIPEVAAIEVVGNGTSLLNLQLMPAIGYSDRVEHKPAWKRRKLGLETDWRQPSADDVSRPHETDHLAWVEKIDMSIRTDPDQSAWHAGKLLREWTEPDGRRGYQYLLDWPTRGWSVILSGRYREQRFQCDGLPDVIMVHDPEHDHVIIEFATAIHDAMAHFAARYGPPPFESFPMVEQSLHFNGMGVRSGIGFSSEILGWKSDLKVSRGEDLAKMSAHMMGMAWFNDQLIPANTPGAKTIHAGLPYWTAALYLHQRRGPSLDRGLRWQEMMELFRGRSALTDEENPFTEEIKDSTVLRRKGGILMTYLASLIGPQELERIIGEFLTQWKYRDAPYPTAQDFLAHLRSRLPEEYHPQLSDIFEHITTWQLGVVDAEAEPTSDNRWKLTATIEAKKFRTTGWGERSEVALETPITIASFRGRNFSKEDLIHSELKTDIPDGRSEITLILDERPTRFGIDPYLLLPDRNPHDNVRPVR